MDAAVVVLHEDWEATRRAASYMNRLLGQFTHPTRLLVPEEVANTLGDGVVEEAFKLMAPTGLGGPSGGSVIGRVNQAVSDAVQDGAEIVSVFDSRVMVSANWRSHTSMARVMYAGCGVVGPQFTGSQHVTPPTDDFAASCQFLAGRFAGKLGSAEVLDPEAFAISADAWREVGPLDDDIEDLSWALRDWCLRVQRSGRRVCVALASYGHLMGGRLHPWAERGFEGRAAFYRKYSEETGAEPNVAALFLHEPQNRHQYSLLLESIRSAGAVVDQIVICLVGHPKEYASDPGPKLHGREAGALQRLARETDINAACLALQKHLGKLVAVPVKVGIVPPGWVSPQALEATAAKACADEGATWCLLLREGDLLPDLDRTELHRLCRHPDPSVTAYNFGLRYSWDSRRLVREDAPYGDGGSLLDDGEGSNDYRLFRSWASRRATDGARVANARILNIGLEAAEYRNEVDEVGMRLSAWHGWTDVGGHMLAYSGEDPEDVARWLDWTHGLVREWVIGWTDDGDHDVHAQAAAAFGARVLRVGVPSGIDFSAWRNGCLDDFDSDEQVQIPPRPHWHAFVDPDEWVGHPVHDLMAWRRLVEQSNRYAWMQRFENRRAGGGDSQSSVARLWLTGLAIRFSGRVHETPGDTLVAPKRPGFDIGVSPITVQNRGTADLATSHEKLALYHRLIREELEEHPESSRHWVLLSYQYAADGHVHEAMTCLERAILTASTTAFLPWYDLGMLHLRQARRGLREALRRLPPGNDQRPGVEELLEALARVADPVVPDDDAEPEPLPDFPEELRD